MTVPRLGIDIARLLRCWKGRPFWLIKLMQWLGRTGRGRADCAANVIMVLLSLQGPRIAPLTANRYCRRAGRRWSAIESRAKFAGTQSESPPATASIHPCYRSLLPPRAKFVFVLRATSITCLHKPNRSVALARPDPLATCSNMARRRYPVAMPCPSEGTTSGPRMQVLLSKPAKIGRFLVHGGQWCASAVFGWCRVQREDQGPAHRDHHSWAKLEEGS